MKIISLISLCCLFFILFIICSWIFIYFVFIFVSGNCGFGEAVSLFYLFRVLACCLGVLGLIRLISNWIRFNSICGCVLGFVSVVIIFLWRIHCFFYLIHECIQLDNLFYFSTPKSSYLKIQSINFLSSLYSPYDFVTEDAIINVTVLFWL